MVWVWGRMGHGARLVASKPNSVMAVWKASLGNQHWRPSPPSLMYMEVMSSACGGSGSDSIAPCRKEHHLAESSCHGAVLKKVV